MAIQPLLKLEPSRNAMFLLHGVMLLVAFIIIFPVGAIAIKSGSFKYHWMVQVAACILTITGIVIGLVLSPNIRSSYHKQLGVVIGFLLILQLVSGWRHHVIFSKIRQRTWISITHTWLGRSIVGAGWCNLVLGLSLGGFADKYIYLVAVMVSIEAIALVMLHYRHNETASETQKKTYQQQRWSEEVENHFALEEENSDDDDDNTVRA